GADRPHVLRGMASRYLGQVRSLDVPNVQVRCVEFRTAPGKEIGLGCIVADADRPRRLPKPAADDRVILEVLANAGQMGNSGDTETIELCAVAYARQHQQLWGLD